MLEAARVNEVNRFLFTSFACVYPGYRKDTPDVTPLAEEHAYPADAEDGYGWVPQTILERGIEITYRWIQGLLRVPGDVSA